MKMIRQILAAAAACAAFAAHSQTADDIRRGIYGDIPDYGEKYLSPDFVKCAEGKIYVTCRTGDELLVVSPAGKVLGSVPVAGHPSGLALSADLKRAYITIAAPDGKIARIDLASMKVDKIAAAGHMPRAATLSADGKTLYAANQFEDKVRAFDAETFAEKASGAAVRDPFALALSKDQKKLFVLNQLPESKGGLYEENIACAVSVLDANTLAKIRDIALPNGSIDAEAIALSPDGKRAYCTHVVARFNVPTTQVERGWINTNAVSVIDTEKNRLIATFLIDDIELGAANPYGIICADGGKYLAIAQSGTHELSVIDRAALEARIAERFAKSDDAKKTFDDICNDLSFLSGIRRRIPLDGLGPRHLDASGKIAYVGMYYSDTLNSVDLRSGKVSRISIGGNEKLNEIRRGDLFFHDGSLCFQKWLSCVTCHTEVRSDALNWDLLNDGIGNPKQSKSMLYAHFTPPSMITGVRKNAPTAVRKGMQFIQFMKRPERDAACIDKYLSALKAVPSPYLTRNGEMSEAAKRGEIIFEEAKCSVCHTGAYYTDMKMHDVGSGLDEYDGKPFDTPTLCEVWRTAPYLYDGRARTIYDLFKHHNKGDKHGHTSKLSDDELRDLEAFVLTL